MKQSRPFVSYIGSSVAELKDIAILLTFVYLIFFFDILFGRSQGVLARL